MKSKTIMIALSAMALLSTACSRKSGEMIIGGEKDSHGCLVSAGYTWSKVKNDCIRIFDDGVALINSKDKNATSAAYIVFSQDSTRVELFLPTDEEGSRMLFREGADASSWSSNSKFMGAYKIIDEAGLWKLYQGKDLIYESR